MSGTPDKHTGLNDLESVIATLRSEITDASTRSPDRQTPESIDEKKRKLKIENDNAENNQQLKATTLDRLFIFLGIETVIIFVMAFFQGFRPSGFALDDWSFRLIVSATLIQIATMLTIAVRHLFPTPKHSDK